MVPIRAQRAVTHTQAYVGNVLAAAAALAAGSRAPDLGLEADALPDLVARWFSEGESWAAGLLGPLDLPSAADRLRSRRRLARGTRDGAAAEGGRRVPAEGMETREGATSGMYALAPRPPGRLAAHPAPTRTRARPRRSAPPTGARVRPAPGAADGERSRRSDARPSRRRSRLAARLGRDAGLDVDQRRPATAAYYPATARTGTPRIETSRRAHEPPYRPIRYASGSSGRSSRPTSTPPRSPWGPRRGRGDLLAHAGPRRGAGRDTRDDHDLPRLPAICWPTRRSR